MQYVQQAEELQLLAISQALKGIASLDQSEDQRILRRFLDDPQIRVRHPAIMVYFGEERTLDAVPLAVAFLNSDAETPRKRRLIGLLRRKNQAVLDSLKTQPAKITSSDVRSLLEDSKRKSRRSVGRQKTPSQVR